METMNRSFEFCLSCAMLIKDMFLKALSKHFPAVHSMSGIMNLIDYLKKFFYGGLLAGSME